MQSTTPYSTNPYSHPLYSDLTKKTLISSSAAPSGFHTPEDLSDENEIETPQIKLCKHIQELPPTRMFDELKKSATAIFNQNFNLSRPKKAEISFKYELKRLSEECPALEAKVLKCSSAIDHFFTTMSESQDLKIIENFSMNLKSLETEFKKLSQDYNVVKDWISKEQPLIRNRIGRGTIVEITPEQRNFIAHQLRHCLSKEIIEEKCQASDKKHATRLHDLTEIEKQWDTTCLAMQQIRERIFIVNTIIPSLALINSIKQESENLKIKIIQLGEDSLPAELNSVTQKISQSKVMDKSASSLKKSIDDCIKQKNELFEETLKLNIALDYLSNTIDENLNLFNNFKKIKENYIPFSNSLKNAVKNEEAKNKILTSSDELVAKFSKLLVNKWNELSLNQLIAENELNIAEHIQNTCAQLDDLKKHVVNICSTQRESRKYQDCYYAARKTFDEEMLKFNTLATCMNIKNHYPISRVDDAFIKKGFFHLYLHTTEALQKAISDLKTTKTANDFKAYKLKSYSGTIETTLSELNKVCDDLAIAHIKILNIINGKYAFLTGELTGQLLMELNRANNALTYVEKNWETFFKKDLEVGKADKKPEEKQIASVRGAYERETLYYLSGVQLINSPFGKI